MEKPILTHSHQVFKSQMTVRRPNDDTTQYYKSVASIKVQYTEKSQLTNISEQSINVVTKSNMQKIYRLLAYNTLFFTLYGNVCGETRQLDPKVNYFGGFAWGSFSSHCRGPMLQWNVILTHLSTYVENLNPSHYIYICTPLHYIYIHAQNHCEATLKQVQKFIWSQKYLILQLTFTRLTEKYSKIWN